MKIAIIGLGYVGLPLASAFSKKYKVIGFDVSKKRVSELKNGHDRTLEHSRAQIKKALDNHIHFTNNIEDIAECNFYIVTVPTPIYQNKNPDLRPLIKSSETVGQVLSENDIVIYESTVYPGAIEEVCVPILERVSNLKFNKQFFCGYSPERINPGDKTHTLINIVKVTSGSTPEAAQKVDKLYSSIISAGTHLAPSIKVAEAAKVIENAQRDINIAFVNELSLIFNKLEIDTESVLEAARTKWNFLPFTPGLVGGHCIGVDPYYLAFKAIKSGHNPRMLLSGRELNDSMGNYIVSQVLSLMSKKNINIINSDILIMGLTFKENCPDIRNTGVVDLITGFQQSKCNVDVYDPWVDMDEAINHQDINPVKYPTTGKYNAIVLAVAHDEFKKMSLKTIKSFGCRDSVIYDIKYLFNANQVDGRL